MVEMGRTTLQKKLTFLFGAIIVAVVLVVGGISVYHARDLLIEQARRTGVALAGSIAAASSNDFFNYNYVGLEQKAEEASRDPEVAYVILYDKEGRVAAYSGQGSAESRPAPENLEPALTATGNTLVSDSLMEGFSGRGLDIVVPVTMAESSSRWGSVRLGLRLDRIYNRIELLMWLVFFLCLAGVLIGAAASAVFTRRITVPLKNLVDAAVQVSEGDFQTQIQVETGDEVQDLADNFNWMVSQLAQQRSSLVKNLQEIQRLKHYSDLVILSITNGLVTMGSDGKIISFNRVAERILDASAGDVLGRTPTQVWGSQPAVAMMEAAPGGGGTPREDEVRWVTSDGQERILQMTTTDILEGDGTTVGRLALFSDLTEKKELEKRVKRADRLAALGTLAAGLAHEIRNPLTAIRTFVQLVPERHENALFMDKFNRTVPRELDRVNNLLEDLLGLVRKPVLNITRIRIKDCVDQVLETLEPEIDRMGVDVQVNIDQGSGPVRADMEYLTRAIFNVILNAVQAMPQGGSLLISSEKSMERGEQAAEVITISDDGFGIPDEYLDQVFNPFFTNKDKGTGLGLAVTNKIIEDLGGSISVRSERGRGTEFTISLPLFDLH